LGRGYLAVVEIRAVRKGQRAPRNPPAAAGSRYAFQPSTTRPSGAWRSQIPLWLLVPELCSKKNVGIAARLRRFFYLTGFSRTLPPVVVGVGEAIVHHGVEIGVLLDKDFAEGAVLAEQNRLKADQLQ